MKLLRAADAPLDRHDLVVRHGRFANIFVFVILAAAVGGIALMSYVVLHSAPLVLGILGGAFFGFIGLLLVVATHGAAQIIARSFGPQNWLARVRSTSIDIHFRSYQNAHFPDDAPTVVHFDFSEIACVRRVNERWTELHDRDQRATRTRRWLEFELRGVDVGSLAKALRQERERPGPERSFLGIRGRTRFGHVVALLTDSGRLRVLDISAKLRDALKKRVPFDRPVDVDLDLPNDGGLDSRVRLLIARGETLQATALVRDEMGVSLTEAKHFVDELRPAA